MKILLLGATGQVGAECRRSLAWAGELTCTTRDGKLSDGARCQFADFDRPALLRDLVRSIAPDVVVNAAAYTAVDKAESEPELAFRINAEAPGAIADACAEVGAYLIHYSTDYVFNGTASDSYKPDEATAPLGVYGASKLAGENAIRASGCEYAILRTSWVYASHGRNFLLTMLRLGSERDELFVVDDQIGTPTPAPLLAEMTAWVARDGNRRSGTWHLVPHGRTSWHGFAEAIFAEALACGVLPRAPVVRAIATAGYPTPARRPAWSVLDNQKFEQDFDIALPTWQEGLRRVMSELTGTRSCLPKQSTMDEPPVTGRG